MDHVMYIGKLLVVVNIKMECFGVAAFLNICQDVFKSANFLNKRSFVDSQMKGTLRITCPIISEFLLF